MIENIVERQLRPSSTAWTRTPFLKTIVLFDSFFVSVTPLMRQGTPMLSMMIVVASEQMASWMQPVASFSSQMSHSLAWTTFASGGISTPRSARLFGNLISDSGSGNEAISSRRAMAP